MTDKEDMYLLMEFRQSNIQLWEDFLKDKGKLQEWEDYIK